MSRNAFSDAVGKRFTAGSMSLPDRNRRVRATGVSGITRRGSGKLLPVDTIVRPATGKTRDYGGFQTPGFGGQRRRSRVTQSFLERFVFAEIAAIMNRIEVVHDVVVMDTGWILCTRNVPGEETTILLSLKNHTCQQFDPHCERYDDNWRFYCEDFFDLSHAIEFIPVHPSKLRPATPQGDFAQWEREMKEHAIGTVVCLAPDKQISAESPEYAAWLTRHEGANSAASTAASPSGAGTTLPGSPSSVSTLKSLGASPAAALRAAAGDRVLRLYSSVLQPCGVPLRPLARGVGGGDQIRFSF